MDNVNEGVWVYVEDAKPSEPDANVVYDCTQYLVTDGISVGVCDWQRGHGCGEPWAAWSNYGDFKPAAIIAWMAKPKPALSRALFYGEAIEKD